MTPNPDELTPRGIAEALSWLVRHRREHGGRPTPPGPLDDLRAQAAACRRLAGPDALAVVRALGVEAGGDDLRFGVAGAEQPVDFGTLTGLLERGLRDGLPDDLLGLLDKQPALLPPLARALRGGAGAALTPGAGADLRTLLMRCPALLELAAEPGAAGSGTWLGPLLGGDLRFLGLADGFESPPARVAVLLAVGSPAARAPAEAALRDWVDSTEHPSRQALAGLVDSSRSLGPGFLLEIVRQHPELASALTRSARAAAYLHLDPVPLRSMLAEQADTDVRAAAQALLGVGATDPHLTNRLLRGQADLVARVDGGFVEPHHRIYAWGATGSPEAVPRIAESLEGLFETWAASKPVVERSRALPSLLDHPCLSPRLLGALQAQGVIEVAELFVVLVRDPRGPGDWGDPPWPWKPPAPVDVEVGERLVSWLCSSPPSRLTELSAGPSGLSVSRLLALACLAWERGQVSLPVLLGLGRSFGLGRAGPAWVAEAVLRFLDALTTPGQRRAAAAELLDLLQPEPTTAGEPAICEAIARALPAPVAEPFVDFAVTRDWATRTGHAGRHRERQATLVLDAIERSWRRRSPRRLNPILPPLFPEDRVAVAAASSRALRTAIKQDLDPRWLVPAVLGCARASTLDALQRAMGEQRLDPELRETALEILPPGHPHPAGIDAALRRAGVGAVLRSAILEAAADRLLPDLLQGVLLDAVEGGGQRSRLQRNVIEAVLAAHDEDPATLARALDRVLATVSWAGDRRWLEGILAAAGALGADVGRLRERIEEIAATDRLPEGLRATARAAAEAIADPEVASGRQRVGRARRALIEAWVPPA